MRLSKGCPLVQLSVSLPANRWDKPKLMGSDDIQMSEEEAKEKEMIEMRADAYQKRREEWDKEAQAKIDAEKAQAVAELRAKWDPYLEDAKETGELLNCWKELLEIDGGCFELTELKAMRLVGHKITVMPTDVGDKLTQLTSLSLSNNELTTIPPNIENLKSLKELNLLKNKLTYLPETLCNLTSLTMLELSNNRLRSLPENIGKLQKLPRLTVEHNRLQELPDSLCNLNCKALRLAHNELERLPDGLCNSTTLVQLTLDHNKLTRLPAAIGQIPTLKVLTACANKLRVIPDSVVDMKAIEWLWLGKAFYFESHKAT